MATLRIQNFSGVAPLFEPRQLPDSNAVSTIGSRFQGGDLRALRASQFRQSWAFQPGTLFYHRNQLLGWPLSPYGEVSPVPSPIPQDTLQRLYWSRWDGNPDGPNWPQAASQPTPGDIASQTANIRRLGVPAPATAPTLTEETAISSVAALTISPTSPVRVGVNMDPTKGQVGHPFKEGDRVQVRFLAKPATEGEGGQSGMRELAGLEFIVGAVTSSTFDLRGTDGSNYSEYNPSDPATISKVYGVDDITTRSYVYTFVSDWGEEGPPSPPSVPTDIRFDSNVRLSISGTKLNNYGGINRVRIYRSATSAQQAGFFFLAEVSISSQTSYSATYLDQTTEEAMFTAPNAKPDSTQSASAPRVLGESLPSVEWTPPPRGLRGLVSMPNGFLVGFIGNTLYSSVPFMPHAWPDRYRRTVPDDIQGIAVAGQALVIATKGRPQIAYGTDPGSLSIQEVEFDAPCIVPASVCSIGSGVVFISHDGLILISGNAPPRNLTERFFSKDAWKSTWSPTMRAMYHDRRLILMSTDPSRPSLMMEIDGDRVHFSLLTDQGRALAVNPDNDTLQFISSLGSFLQQWEFDPPGGLLQAGMSWRSKVFTLPKQINLSCGQVFATAYPLTLKVFAATPGQAVPLGNASVAGQTLPTLAQRANLTVYGPDPFRLPDGFIAREWQFEVSGATVVHRMEFAESMDELART